MTTHVYPACEDCYFNDGRAPAICEECIDGDEYEPMLEFRKDRKPKQLELPLPEAA